MSQKKVAEGAFIRVGEKNLSTLSDKGELRTRFTLREDTFQRASGCEPDGVKTSTHSPC
jgi:hypothetical protein